MAKVENYSGSVELISGIKQKNNGDFPLMEANAVQTRSDGTRLDAELEELRNNSGTGGANVGSGTGSGSIQQKADGVADGFDFTGKNTNATAYDSSLTGVIPYGATGAFSSAFGGKSSAQGKRSHAEGTTTIAKGAYSHAEGDNSVSIGNDSHAEGYSTTSYGTGSHSEGTQTVAEGEYSHAEGIRTKASLDGSHAEGCDTTASGEHAHAEGNGTTASGTYSHAEGNGTTASGTYSHAEGARAAAGGIAAHAEGIDTTASGEASHAEGTGCTASGTHSHAGGVYSTAKGFGAFAHGDHVTAESDHQVAVGRYNKNTAGNLFEVGNGSEGATSNAFEVLGDGRAKVYSPPIDDNDVVRKADVAVISTGKKLLWESEYSTGTQCPSNSTTEIFTHTETLLGKTLEIIVNEGIDGRIILQKYKFCNNSNVNTFPMNQAAILVSRFYASATGISICNLNAYIKGDNYCTLAIQPSAKKHVFQTVDVLGSSPTSYENANWTRNIVAVYEIIE